MYKLSLTTNNKKNIDYLYKISNLFFKSPIMRPKEKKISVLIRSPHVFAKSKERYQTFIYSLVILCPNSSILRNLLKLLPIDIELMIKKVNF